MQKTEMIKVYMGKERKVVNVEVVKRNPSSVLVKLPDGNVIVRKQKQIVTES